MTEQENTNHYFVDEAGDLTFFDRKGIIIVGKPGASKFFMVGVAQIFQPEQVTLELAELSKQLCFDPRFKDIPSMQPSANKTAITFHAKDDHQDVRIEVFKLMQTFDVKMYVAIRIQSRISSSYSKNFQLM